MRSRGEAGASRLLAERALRGASLVALAGLLALAVRDRRAPAPAFAQARRADSRGLREALARWSTREAPASAHVTLDAVPVPELRDWLAALEATGTRVTWGGRATPSAVSVEPVADPQHPTRIGVVAPNGSDVALEDALGPLDSVRLAGDGAAIVVPGGSDVVRARIGNTVAVARSRDSLLLRRVLVLGAAGWEAKFVAAALAERGWAVDARLAVAPSGDAALGVPAERIDTARYAAVVALDSTAARWAQGIARFVRAGGGLVATAAAARVPDLAPLLPSAAPLAASDSSRFDADSAQPRRALALSALGGLTPDALPLERRGAFVAVAARRLGRGRVVQTGYVDTWRWRMAGVEPDPVAAHRAWWSSLVSTVAYAPRIPLSGSSEADPAPYASLVDRLGAPSAAIENAPRSSAEPPWVRAMLFTIFILALLAEVASRRVRGAR